MIRVNKGKCMFRGNPFDIITEILIGIHAFLEAIEQERGAESSQMCKRILVEALNEEVISKTIKEDEEA